MKSIIEKPWGSYQVLEEGDKYVVKKIIVNPGAKLSLQSHKYRSEHWIIAKGEAEVTVDEETNDCTKEKSFFVIFTPSLFFFMRFFARFFSSLHSFFCSLPSLLLDSTVTTQMGNDCTKESSFIIAP